jgi:phytanoyl-CoA hydroxylase
MRSDQLKFFETEGFLAVEDVLNQKEIEFYDQTYSAFINNEFDLEGLRSDLSGSKDEKKELITQIMLPSSVYPDLLQGPMHTKGLEIAKQLLGKDMILDFDMLINKAPHTDKPTPWHQDAAYWIDMPDKRALSIWFAIDEATLENGCMWYTPKSHKEPLRKHFQPFGEGALQCKGTEKESTAVPLRPGSCAIHHGHTLHYSRGNSTGRNRRAFILNFRPKKMVELERSQGFDHSGKRKVRTKNH